MDKQHHLKGQAAMEFMMLVGVLLFVFLVMLGIVANRTSYINQKRESIIGEDIVGKVQKEINLAARVLDGYSREFYLPMDIGNKEYNISIIGDEVILRTEREDFWRVIPVVTGDVKRGVNIINKTNGIIYIN